MIYVDASVALSAVFGEERRPAAGFWKERLVSSELLRYESWVAVGRRSAHISHGELLRAALLSIGLIGMRADVLDRALEPFPQPLRALDALHLSTADYLRREIPELRVATYDRRLAAAARALRFDVVEP